MESATVQLLHPYPDEGAQATTARLARLRTLLDQNKITDMALTTKEAAECANRSVSCIAQWCSLGRPGVGLLPSTRWGKPRGPRVILLSDLLDYITKVAPVGAPPRPRLTNVQVRSLRVEFYRDHTKGVSKGLEYYAAKLNISPSYVSYLVTGHRRKAAGGPLVSTAAVG